MQPLPLLREGENLESLFAAEKDRQRPFARLSDARGTYRAAFNVSFVQQTR